MSLPGKVSLQCPFMDKCPFMEKCPYIVPSQESVSTMPLPGKSFLQFHFEEKKYSTLIELQEILHLIDCLQTVT